MAKETTHERRNIVLTDAQDYDGVSAMTHVAPEEPEVASEERRPPKPAKLDNNLLVLKPFAPMVHSNLPYWNTPGLQQESLAIEDVFVQEDQA
jgi:hypothetical protein